MDDYFKTLETISFSFSTLSKDHELIPYLRTVLIEAQNMKLLQA